MFFKQTYSGIDFREKHIATATVTIERKLPLLRELEYIALDEENFQGGRVRNLEQLTSNLKASLTKNKSLAKHAHLAIPTQHVILRKITSLPDLAEKVLGRLLHFQIGESIHLPFDNPIYDYSKLGTITVEEHEQEARSEILFIATSRDLSGDLLTCTEQAGIKALSAEIRGLALQRLISVLHPDWLKEIEVVVDLNDDSADIHIYKHGTIVFTRTMPISKANYYLDTSVDDLLILPSQQQMLAELAATTEQEQAEQIWDEDRYIYDLVNEIEKAQNFYRYSMDERETEFKRVIITGEFSSSIFQKLTERVAYPVIRLEFSPLLPSSHFEAVDMLDACSVAIGLALRGKEKAHKHSK